MEEKKKYFVSDLYADLPVFRDLSAHLIPVWRKWLMTAAAVFALCYVLTLAFWDPKLLKWMCAVYWIVIAVVWMRNRDGGNAYRKYLEMMGGVPRRNLIYIREDGIRFRNPETENVTDAAYRDIISITRTRLLLILNKADGSNNLIHRTNLTGGTADELEQWLMEQTGVGRVKRPFDSRILQRIVSGIMAAGLILALFLDGGFPASASRRMPHSEAVRVLTELGIQVPESELDEDIPSEYILEELLCRAGMGEYNDDTFEWTPAQSGVYAFDLEFFEVGSMYTSFLLGVEAMSRGELIFTDITEDDSHVDFESGGGWKEVTFTFNGQTYTLRPEMMYDWFDPNFANALAELTEDPKTGKQLRFYFDGYQMAYLFWCDDAWAKDFAKATGLRLKDGLG